MSAGLTQRMLAVATGVSVGALRDLEQGRTWAPQWGTMDAIAAALSMDRYQRAELVSAWCGDRPDGAGGYFMAQPEGRDAGARARIGVLGPLTVVRGGVSVSPGSLRQQTVLGLLALHWSAGVSRNVIVDVLWGDRPPPSAVTQVEAYVSRLRQFLNPGREVRGRDGPVVLAGRSYRLADRVDLDVAEFGRLSRGAEAAADRGQFRLGCALCERSLSLWRGEVLDGIDLLRDYPAVTELTRGRGEVVRRFARAAAAIGADERALPQLRMLCAREPFNEAAHAELMTALAATGRQADALHLFRDLSRRLDIELGVGPGPQLAAAHLRIIQRQG